MKPSPWHVLVNSTLLSYLLFQQSFGPYIHPKFFQEWKDHGLLSGLMQRMFAVFDTNASHKIDFNECLVGIHILCKAGENEKLGLAYQFCDLDRD